MTYSPYSGSGAKYPASSTYATTPVKQETYPSKFAIYSVATLELAQITQNVKSIKCSIVWQFFLPFLLAEEGRYGAQTTHVTYATQSAHTYQQTAQPQSAAYAREPPASNSSKYGTTAASQSAFSSYPSHYAAHQQKTITDAHYPAGYRVPAQAGQHGKLLNTKYHHGPDPGFPVVEWMPTSYFAKISPKVHVVEGFFLGWSKFPWCIPMYIRHCLCLIKSYK